jgi:hypothetical protein
MLKGHVRAMTEFIEWNFIFPVKWPTEGSATLELMPYESLHKPLAKER